MKKFNKFNNTIVDYVEKLPEDILLKFKCCNCLKQRHFATLIRDYNGWKPICENCFEDYALTMIHAVNTWDLQEKDSKKEFK